MKELIYGCSIFLAIALFLTESVTFDVFKDNYYELKDVTDECSAGGALYFNKVSFSNGYYIYNDADILAHTMLVLNTTLGVKSDYTFEATSYWQGPAILKVYIADDNYRVRIYTNGILTSNNVFAYGDTVLETINSEPIIINNPTVIIAINVGESVEAKDRGTTKQVTSLSQYEYRANK